MTPPAQPAAHRPRPRVAVYGAGSIGCRLGGALAPFADVTLIGRPAAMDTLRATGLTLTGGGRPPQRVAPDALRIATEPRAVEGADYVLVTVKSAATAQAAREMAAHLGPGTVVVSFQNGLRNPGVLADVLPGHTVLTGMVPYNVVQTGPGVFHQGSAGALMVDDHAEAAALAEVATAAGLPVRRRRDMREVQYAKLLMNLNNAVNALSGLPLREELGRRDYRGCLALCQTEALAAFRAAGIRPARLGPVPPSLTPGVLRLPDALFRRLAGAALRIDAHARSSTWEDLRRGRPTEIDSLQGEVVALAERHGVPAPANSRLIALIRQAEAAGPDNERTWSGPELLAELTAPHTA